jgi:hypothetical protein
VRCGKDKNFLPLAGISLRFFGFSARGVVAISTSQDDNITDSLGLFIYINFLPSSPSPMKMGIIRLNRELTTIMQIFVLSCRPVTK